MENYIYYKEEEMWNRKFGKDLSIIYKNIKIWNLMW